MRGARRHTSPAAPPAQLGLFDAPPAPPAMPPAQRHSATSMEAARLISGKAGTLREKVRQFLELRGKAGATDEEIQSGLVMAANTERPRRRELEQAGIVRDSGMTRTTTSGRAATVWVLATPS